ncbi:MAG: hypothetical protein LLG20_01140 [Acidobacteriales bacterium]|nr:hypothetical protein [Terriglobales bacterium]
MSTPESHIDVEQIMDEIRERVRSRVASTPQASGPAAPLVSDDPADFNDLLRLIEHARRCSAAIGTQPPQPPTLRARLSSILVRLVRRMLFWYTPQITDFNEVTLRALEEQVAALESVSTSLHARIASLERRLAGSAADSGAHEPRP